MERDCANYDCVQLAVVRYASYLATDPGSSESMKVRRANALKFVGHFVGDLHQPLHTGYAYDRGGNGTAAQFFDEDPSNLHGIWDYAIRRAWATTRTHRHGAAPGRRDHRCAGGRMGGLRRSGLVA